MSAPEITAEERTCFFISRTMVKTHRDGTRHFYPAIVVERKAGYYLTNWDYGTDFALAEEAVASLNKRRGFSDDDLSEIILSSQQQRKAT